MGRLVGFDDFGAGVKNARVVGSAVEVLTLGLTDGDLLVDFVDATFCVTTTPSNE